MPHKSKSPDQVTEQEGTGHAGTGQPPGSERARDEQREHHGPTYAGGDWKLADERGDRRFGHARIDDADPSELAPGEAANDDDESPNAADPELAAAEAAGEIESGGEIAGMRRGEKPRKPKAQEKPNPKPNTKTKKKHS